MLKQQKRGVSPVIGIILMVAVTVGLVALAATIVFDLGSNVSEPADVSAELSTDSTNNEVSATVVRNDNAAAVFLRTPDTDDQAIVGEINKNGGDFESVDTADVGGTGTKTATVGMNSGTAEIVAVVEGTDGQQQVIRSTQYDF